MSPRANQIGFSQRVRLEWLEQTANLVMAGNDRSVVNDSLQDLLMNKVSIGGTAERGNREKIITILLKIWVNVPTKLEPLRVDGFELLKCLPHTDHIAIHWGMAMAVYPFWAAVASYAGRLLRLQSSVGAAHVQRRMREQYGERDTVSRAARRVLRSFIDWGALKETSTKGVYDQGLCVAISNPKLTVWLIEACLHARPNGSAAPIKDLFNNTSLFPFHFAAVPSESLVVLSPRLELLRHGLDDDLVLLRK